MKQCFLPLMKWNLCEGWRLGALVKFVVFIFRALDWRRSLLGRLWQRHRLRLWLISHIVCEVLLCLEFGGCCGALRFLLFVRSLLLSLSRFLS